MKIQSWRTSGDKRALLEKGQSTFTAGQPDPAHASIVIDADKSHQKIEGFGFTLTGGSASLLAAMDKDKRGKLLQELFGRKDKEIGISYLRLSIGASDLGHTVYSYNDLPKGQKDPLLKQFNLAAGDQEIVPILQEILKINPDIKLMGSPWSAPPWMKTNENSEAGHLRADCYGVYADYLVRYLQEMKANGITVHAITVQNEPHNIKNNPSMMMDAPEQAEFIRDHLGPKIEKSGLGTEIYCWDHNCDLPAYPMSLLDDAAVRRYITGVAWHLYGGEPEAIAQVLKAHPDKKMALTEQWVGSDGKFDGDLRWHGRKVMIGVLRNGGGVVLEWNLASDPNCKPHTPGGSPHCVGGVTIDGNNVTRNVGYYLIAHAAKFIPPGSERIGSNEQGNILNAAFRTPDGRIALMVLNDGQKTQKFNVVHNGHAVTMELEAGALGTYCWDEKSLKQPAGAKPAPKIS